MAIQQIEIININASRISNLGRVNDLFIYLTNLNPTVVCIQEINVFSVLSIFRGYYQIFVNYYLEGNNNIGIVTLIKNDVKIVDQLISLDGRILGIKCKTVQIWNVYPLSGAENKKQRESFFRETLNNLMVNWKDHTKYLFQLGDHNCIYRKEDSLNNPVQHMQQGLISHLKIHGLNDGFTQVHGEQTIMYSRVTNRSATRIDYIFSNSKNCSSFEYIDAGLGYDHKAVVANYDIEMVIEKSFIPRKHYFNSWVIPKFLEEDKIFLREAKLLFDDLWSEFNENNCEDISFFWDKGKKLLIHLAQNREKQINFEENERLNTLKIFYNAYLEGLKEGSDCKADLIEVKKEIVDIQKGRSKKLIDKMRGNEIDDHIYDIHKLQRGKNMKIKKS